MNKKNKILVGCLSLLLVLSVGYALFSETITINGTATAKGSFNIDGSTCEVVTEANQISGERYTTGGSGTCKIENGVIKTTSNLTKPGDQVWFRVNLKNTGTITAKLKTVDSLNNMDSRLNAAGDAAYLDSKYFLMGCYFFENHEDDGAMGDSEAEALGLTLQPNATEPLIILHEWLDMGDNQPAVPTNGATMNYNIALGFEQVTAN